MRLRLLSVFLTTAFSLLFCSCNDHDDEHNVVISETLSVNNGAGFLSLDYQARTGNLSVRSTRAWTISTDADWIELSAKQGSVGTTNVAITLDSNEGKARFAVLKFANSLYTLNFVVSQSAKNTNFTSPTHYFYITLGTMPTLYAGLFMLAYDKPSYMYYSRTGTFNPEKFPAYVTSAPYYIETDLDKVRDYMKAKIMEINRDNPTAVFGLMVDDLRARLGYDWFVGQGIDSSRVKVTLLSDGTGTYNEFYKDFGNSATAETNWNQYVAEIEKLDWNHSGKYPVSRSEEDYNSFGWAYYMSTLPNYRLLLQDQSLLETDSQFIKDQLPKMDMLSITPYELLDGLATSSRYRFFEMANFNYDEFAALFDASPKPNLIIIGTSGEDVKQKEYTQKIYDQYSSTHNIFFKPHPADLSSIDYETLFPGLTLLPGRMPFEIFVWSLLDKIDVIGGFQSTVFLTVPVDKVGFIFAPNAQSLPRPLNLLFANATNVEWIQ